MPDRPALAGTLFLALLTLAGTPCRAQLATSPAEPTAPASPEASGPLRLDRDIARLGSRDSLLLIAAGGALAALTWNAVDPDRAMARFDASALDPLYDVGNEYGSGVTMGAGSLLLLGAGGLTGSRSLVRLGGDLTRSFALGGSLAWGLKAAFQRQRPGGGPHSFPSGHTTIAFAAAPVFAKHLGWRGGVLAYGIAAGTACGRLEERRHFTSDVIFGAALGLAVGRAVAGETGLGSIAGNFSLGPGVVAWRTGF